LATTKNFPKALEERINDHPSMQDSQASPVYSGHERSLEDYQQLWDFTLKIFHKATECQLDELGEEEWSDKVVLKLFEFSNEWCGFEKTMKLVNLYASTSTCTWEG
jgi:hypothetical protein